MSLLDTINQKKGAFIIAEVGVNYYDMATDLNMSVMDAAKHMIDEAADAGADAVKFQTYTAGKIVSKVAPAYWDQSEEPTSSQYELFQKFDKFGEAEYKELADHCEKKGTMFLSTPFDFEAADYLDDLMPLYKISSSDLTNIPFIEHIARKGKPILLSTGAANIAEIHRAVDAARNAGNPDVAIMHCILDYPTAFENANLNMIKHLGKVFPGIPLGFSDHTRPDESMVVLTTAYLFGAKYIEKHFTLNKSLPGNDHYHAMDPTDLAKFVKNVELIGDICGVYEKQPLPCEAESRKQARRSIVALKDIQPGDVISRDNVTFKRPGTGISPSDFHLVEGRHAREAIAEDALLQWTDL